MSTPILPGQAAPASPTPVAKRRTIEVVWLLGALLVGILGGLSVTASGGRSVMIVLGILAAIVAVSLIFRDTRNGLYLMLLALPLDLAGRIITEPYTLTIYHVVLVVSLLSWGIRAVREGRDRGIEVSFVHLGVLALVLAALWSLPFSLDQHGTVVGAIRLTFSAAFFALFIRHIRDARTMDRVLVFLVVTSACAAALAVLQYFVPTLALGELATVGRGMERVIRPAAFFDDPNYLAGMLSVGIVAALGRASYAADLRLALPWLTGAAVSGVGLLLTLSRTGWVGVAAGLAIVVLAAPVKRRAWLVIGVAATLAIVLAASPTVVLERAGSISDVEGDASVSTRFVMFDSSIAMFRDNWVHGVGLEAFDDAYPAYRRIGSMRTITKPHQLPLALPAMMGIAGLLAELLILAGVVIEVVRHRTTGWDAWLSVAVAGLVALLVQTLFQYYLYFEYLWLFLALTVAATRISRSAEEVSHVLTQSG